MSAFLTFENVTKSFGALRAVDGVTLEIARGEVFSLLGPSGCGKTTLLRLAAGFEAPDRGRILLDSRDITALPPEKRPVNTVFQNYALFPHLTVRDNIAFGLRMAKLGKQEIAGAVICMLELIRLRDHADKHPGQLSGGQKQRVAIARALINKPEVLLLDEPLAALDLKLRQHMLAELRTIHEAAGVTFIYVTHDQTEAMGLSDRIAVMNAGRIEQVGPPDELYDKPRTHFVANFIGDANFLTGMVVAAHGDLCEINVPGLGKFTALNRGVPAVGTTVEMFIRPERIQINPYGGTSVLPMHEQGRDVLATNFLPVHVNHIVYLGSRTRWIAARDEHSFTIEGPLDPLTASLRKGEAATLSFDARDVLLLPAQ